MPSLEERIRRLSLQATELKDSDINAAIACLVEAQALAEESDIDYPPAWWLRLPLFLQRAGRMAEAQSEFDRQLRAVPANVSKHFSHVPKEKHEWLAAGTYATIYDKLRLAWKREGDAERAKASEAESLRYRRINRDGLAAEQKNRAERVEARRAHRPIE